MMPLNRSLLFSACRKKDRYWFGSTDAIVRYWSPIDAFSSKPTVGACVLAFTRRRSGWCWKSRISVRRVICWIDFAGCFVHPRSEVIDPADQAADKRRRQVRQEPRPLEVPDVEGGIDQQQNDAAEQNVRQRSNGWPLVPRHTLSAHDVLLCHADTTPRSSPPGSHM